MKIRSKFILSTLIPLILLFSIFTLYSITEQRKIEEIRLKSKIKRTSTLLKLVNVEPLWSYNTQVIKINCESFFKDKEITKIFIKDHTTGKAIIDLKRDILEKRGKEIIINEIIKKGDNNIADLQIIYTTALIEEKLIKIIKNNMIKLLVIIIFLAAISTFLALKTIINPIKKIEEYSKKVTDEEFDKKCDIKSNDEIGNLAYNINMMVEKLQKNLIIQKEQSDKLAAWNKILDQTVKERTASISNLLNHAGQGFLTLDTNLCVNKEYSSECINIFGSEIEGKKIYELVHPNDDDKRNFLKLLLVDILEEKDEYKKKIYFPLLPDEVVINNKNIHIDYKIIGTPEKEKNQELVMLILTDFTDKYRLEKQMDREKNVLKMVVKVITHYNDFKESVSKYNNFTSLECDKILSENDTLQNIVFKIYRNIHTFKGVFGQFGLISISEKLHNLESEISCFNKDIENKNLKEFKGIFSNIDMEKWLKEDFKVLKNILGESFFDKKDVLVISRLKIIELEQKIQNLFSPFECKVLLPELKQLRFKPFKEILKISSEYINQLSNRFEKPVNPLVIKGGDILVDVGKFNDFSKSLVHIFRNIFDHGIESIEERIAQGKEENGNIKCSIQLVNDKIIFIISDDGQGISIEKIKETAVEKGFYTEEEISKFSEQKILNLIFDDDFSTRKKITEFSGRGIGLSAVKEEVSKLNGEVKAQTTPGKGTEFIFTFAYDKLDKFSEIDTSPFLKQIIEATIDFFYQQIEVVLTQSSSVRLTDLDNLSLNRITAFINIRGIIQGILVMSLDESLAMQLARKYVVGFEDGTEEKFYMEDTLSECLNTILGRTTNKNSNVKGMIQIESPISINSTSASLRYYASNVMTYNFTSPKGNLNVGFIST